MKADTASLTEVKPVVQNQLIAISRVKKNLPMTKILTMQNRLKSADHEK